MGEEAWLGEGWGPRVSTVYILLVKMGSYGLCQQLVGSTMLTKTNHFKRLASENGLIFLGGPLIEPA
jgi:hypothetical protein